MTGLTADCAAVFRAAADRLYDYCEYPAVRYNILFRLLGAPYDGGALSALRPAFRSSDIVDELYRAQNYDGGWGPLMSKDYSARDKFPTSFVAINRCLYIGLTFEDGDILTLAYEYLESFLNGTSRERLHNKNERAVPWQTALICELIETVKPYNELCDRAYGEWLYIASRAYAGGEYSYEDDRAAQHEIFGTRESRLVPMRFGLLLKRRENVAAELENAMLRHNGGIANERGHFWDKTPSLLPESFYYEKTRRWFDTFNYINQFNGSACYLSGAVDWLLENRGADGLWDWGPQTKDPWGYFGYFSTNRNYKHNRAVDCTMEVLTFLKAYMERNIDV